MRRRLIITLLALGTIGGYASGFASMHCRAQWKRNAFERHVASLCVDAAARRADAERAAAPSAPAAAPTNVAEPTR